MNFSKDLKKRLIGEGFDAHFVKYLMDAFKDIPTQEFARFSINQLDEVIDRVIHQTEKLSEVGLEEKLKIVEILQRHQMASIRATEEPEKKEVYSKPAATPKPEIKSLHFKIQLIEADTKEDKPLSGYKVTVSSLDGKKEKEIIKTVADKNGIFSFTDIETKRNKTNRYDFILYISDPERIEVHTATVSLELSLKSPQIVQIPLTKYRRKSAVPIEIITEALEYSLSSGMFSVLKNNKIETLEDIRKNKGIKHLKDLPVSNDHPDVYRLEGHAYLHVLSKDIILNGFLIEKGYASAADIGIASLSRFTKDTKSKLKKEDAKHLWKRARRQNNVLDLIALNNRITAKTRGSGTTKGGAQGVSDDSSEPCICEDCNSAVSPRAYLVQLLDYAVQNLDITRRNDETEKDLFDWLSETFCLHFDDRSFSCKSMEEEVLQIRLCIEVLRCYLSGQSGDAEIKKFQKAYCLKAYETLLTQIGTSRDELRLIRGADHSVEGLLSKQLEALESRLGFRLQTEGENRIPLLYLHRGASNSRNGITENALEKLFGLLHTEPTGELQNSEPLVKKWRVEYLKEQWKREDRKKSETVRDLPIIDPDLIGVDDLRLPNQNLRVFDLWKKRRDWIDECIVALSAGAMTIRHIFIELMVAPIAYGDVSTEPIVIGTSPGDGRIIDEVFWLREFPKLKRELKEHLPEESYHRLIEIWEKDHSLISLEEKDELISIVMQFQKKLLQQTWQNEEGDLLLGPADFWFSLTEPPLGEWPPKTYKTQPIIDPDCIAKKDLRSSFDMPLNQDHKTVDVLWQDRKEELETLGLEDQAGKANVEGMLKTALSLAEDENVIKTKLDSLRGQSEADNYPTELDDENYYLLETELTVIMGIKMKIGTASPPNDEEWGQVVSILKSAYKRKANWKSHEGSWQYWEILKARLPKWRASTDDRKKWQAALRANSSRPIIEPDVMFPDDIKDDALQQIQNGRNLAVGRISRELGKPDTDDKQLQWFQNTLQVKIGFLYKRVDPGDGSERYEFNDLAKRYEEGQPVLTRLQQIGIPVGAFVRLAKLFSLMQNGETLYDNELREVKTILSSVLKRRLYAQWRKDEANIILEPDRFSPNVPAPENEVDEWHKWRFDSKARRLWQRTLETRSEQLQAIDAGLKSCVATAEETALPILRSGLVDIAYKKYLSSGVDDGSGTNAQASNAPPKGSRKWAERDGRPIIS